VRSHVVRRAVLVLIALSLITASLSAQAQTARPRVALFEPTGQGADVALIAALKTVGDSVELDLACLQRYEVRRLKGVDPARDLDKVRAYCRTNRIDQAIMGSGSAQAEGGYAFKLALYDRRTDSITMVQEGASTGALDMFDATDTMVAALLDKLSGTHLLFGGLVIETEPAGAVVTVNGMEVGPSPLSLRGLPVGTVTVSASSPGFEERVASVKIEDERITNAALSLARSMGTLALDMPQDAVVIIRAAGMEDKQVSGTATEALPTGSYRLEGACPGLPAVLKEITIQRNTATPWMPWSKGYFLVESDPVDARVVVDGVDRGAAPLVVEVDPAILHRVELRKDKYYDYRAELRALPARKVSFEPTLDLKPGSITVVTNPPGAQLRLDDGEFMDAPGTFNGVPVGTHLVRVWDVLVDRRYYTSERGYTVEVKPDEETVLSLKMAPGSASLEVEGAPPSANVLVDGVSWHPGQDIPAGTLDIAVVLPSGQSWGKTITAGSGNTIRMNLDTMTAYVPRKTIKVDGKVDDWAGMESLWGGFAKNVDKYWVQPPTSRTDPFPGITGTRLSGAWLARDDSNIYFRFDFDNGPVSLGLSKDIKFNLIRELHIWLPGRKLLMGNLNSDKTWGVSTWIGLWDESSRSSSNLGTLNAYAISGSTLEGAIPLFKVQQYLESGPLEVEISVDDSGPNGWNLGYSTYRRNVDFLK
jgi:hypothetical protein